MSFLRRRKEGCGVFRYFKSTFSEGFVRLELAGKGSGKDLIVARELRSSSGRGAES